MNAKWRNPTDTEIRNEWDWEYVRHIQGKNPMWDLWETFDTFKSAVKRARKVEVSPSIDRKIEYRSNTSSIESLRDLVSSYQYPRDVDRIVKGYEKGEPIPYPMVLKDGNRMRVLGGNTRMDVARIMNINPVVLMIEPQKGVRESMKLMKILKEDEVGSVWNADDDTQTWNKRFASKHGPGIQIEGKQLDQGIVDDVVEMAAMFSKDEEIWDERDVEHSSIKDLLSSIKNTGFVPSSKWGAFVKKVESKYKNKMNEQGTPPNKVFQVGSDFGEVPDANASAKLMQNKIEAPYVGAQVSTLGGKERVTILLVVSLDKKEDWSNHILENSRYMRFHFYNTGVLEEFSGSRFSKKFRKTTVKSVAEAIAKINQYIGIVKNEKPMYEGSEWEQDGKGEPCYNCGGEGYVQAGHVCPDCRGTGRKDLYENMDDQAAGYFQEADENVDCPSCQGTGQTGHEDCQKCGGTGKLTRMAWERLYGNRKTMKMSEEHSTKLMELIGVDSKVAGYKKEVMSVIESLNGINDEIEKLEKMKTTLERKRDELLKKIIGK